jgi:hypothetical protein
VGEGVFGCRLPGPGILGETVGESPGSRLSARRSPFYGRLDPFLSESERVIDPLNANDASRGQDYAGVYENARLGTMEWRVVGQGLETRMGVAYSLAEVFDARQNQLRVSFTGDWEVVEFAFPPGGGSARALHYRGETFERVKN